MKFLKTLLLSTTLIVIGLLFFTSASADTYTWQCGATVKASYNTSTKNLYISGTGAMYDDWVTPNYAGMKSISIGSGVTSIGPRAFQNLSVTSVTLPSTLTSIGNNAFQYCKNLKSIAIPNNVTSIGEYAFRDCSSLSNVILGNGMSKIPDYMFYGCYEIKSIVLPSGIKEIGNGSFSSTGLTSVTIPDSVTVIGNEAFDSSLEIVDMSKNIQSIGAYAFSFSDIRTIELPSTLTYLGEYAFSSCTYLSDITLPENLSAIPEGAFSGCTSLTEFSINSSTTSIGNSAFKGCISLETINYNAINCSEMGDIYNPVFSGCVSLKNINIASNVENIPAYAFYGCSAVEKLVFPNSITRIGEKAIGGCNSLKELIIPFVGSNIGNTGTENSCLGYIFDYKVNSYGTGSTGYVSQPYLGYGANSYVNFFMPSTLTKIVITDETIIGFGALSNLHSVTEIVLPDTLIRIEEEAFAEDSSLSKINLPINLKYLGSCFRNCSSLSEVIYNAKNCSEYRGAFSGPCGKNAELTIGEDVEFLPSFQGLKTFIVNFKAQNCVLLPNANIPIFSASTEIINIGNNVTKLPKYIFSNCTLLTSIKIPSSVTHIETLAFSQCTGLQNIYYDGYKKGWNNIQIGTNNDLLTSATLHCLPINIEVQKTNNKITVIPNGVYDNSNIIFACYKNDNMVYMDLYPYLGEKTVEFLFSEEYDNIKVFAWENLDSCVPLCEKKEISLDK